MAQDFRSLRASAQTIGFHELRQACEISVLREDLERIVRETGELTAHIEETVEQVRSQFASLTADDLADPERMTPLLQFAVTALIGIRDAARRVNTETGAQPDADRPSPPPLRAVPAAAPFTAPQAAPLAAPLAAMPPSPPASPQAPVIEPFVPPPPAPMAPLASFDPPPPMAPAYRQVEPPPPPAPSAAAWLQPTSTRAPARGAGPARPAPGVGAAKTIDWLSR
ncbi:hypothetical protein [Azospirillum sp.]|uniref:hypothetical protein n=1 Tax=Azospirillum sp. TaxID=34012 RepID=UPI002D5CC13A|nr:hypothetical protein [Azospirillum sp.]HYD64704.1 hypothetical protein [Azospirillum sp.]